MAEQQAAFHLDRARLRASFERASRGYEAAARLQTQVASELLERLELFRFAPRVVLDLGSGTGRATRELKRRYPRARVIALDIAAGMLREARRHQSRWRPFDRVCGDALRLPLKDGSVDLIFSNLMLQWCEPLAAALAEARRVLGSSGDFRYVHQLEDPADRVAMLEFATTVDGKQIEGIDKLTFDENGMIAEFKVLIRPASALQLVGAGRDLALLAGQHRRVGRLVRLQLRQLGALIGDLVGINPDQPPPHPDLPAIKRLGLPGRAVGGERRHTRRCVCQHKSVTGVGGAKRRDDLHDNIPYVQLQPAESIS